MQRNLRIFFFVTVSVRSYLAVTSILKIRLKKIFKALRNLWKKLVLSVPSRVLKISIARPNNSKV